MFKRVITHGVSDCIHQIIITYEHSFEEVGYSSIMLDGKLITIGRITDISDEQQCICIAIHNSYNDRILYIENEVLTTCVTVNGTLDVVSRSALGDIREINLNKDHIYIQSCSDEDISVCIRDVTLLTERLKFLEYLMEYTQIRVYTDMEFLHEGLTGITESPYSRIREGYLFLHIDRLSSHPTKAFKLSEIKSCEAQGNLLYIEDNSGMKEKVFCNNSLYNPRDIVESVNFYKQSQSVHKKGETDEGSIKEF